MNIKIICFNEEKIQFEYKCFGLKKIDSNNFINNKYKRRYYRIENNTIEVIYLDIKDINLEKTNFTNFKYNCDIVLTLTREISEENLTVINKLNKEANSIVAIGEKNLISETEFNELKNVVILNKLKNEEKININLLVLMLLNVDILNSIKVSKENLNIILEKKEKIGDIVMAILKQFNCIQNNKEYNFYLYSKEEVNIQEIAYLEDPIREYINDDAILKVYNLISEKIDNGKYFFISSSK